MSCPACNNEFRRLIPLSNLLFAQHKRGKPTNLIYEVESEMSHGNFKKNF